MSHARLPHRSTPRFAPPSTALEVEASTEMPPDAKCRRSAAGSYSVGDVCAVMFLLLGWRIYAFCDEFRVRVAPHHLRAHPPLVLMLPS